MGSVAAGALSLADNTWVPTALAVVAAEESPQRATSFSAAGGFCWGRNTKGSLAAALTPRAAECRVSRVPSRPRVTAQVGARRGALLCTEVTEGLFLLASSPLEREDAALRLQSPEQSVPLCRPRAIPCSPGILRNADG